MSHIDRMVEANPYGDSKPMTPQEIQIAVAEEMGYQRGKDGALHGPKCDCPCDMPCIVPYYTTSIDAIRQACLERFKTRRERDAFQDALDSRFTETTLEFRWQLTALDWCGAFLATCREIKK